MADDTGKGSFMTDKIEDWARDRVAALCNAEDERPSDAFARYIMQHESAPVDPLLIEAREICAKDCEDRKVGEQYADFYRAGCGDDFPIMRCAYAAIRAGVARNG